MLWYVDGYRVRSTFPMPVSFDERYGTRLSTTRRFPSTDRLNGTLVAGLSFADVAHKHGLHAPMVAK